MNGTIPARVIPDAKGPQVEWLHVDQAPFSEPFFEETLARLGRLPENHRDLRRHTPLEALGRVAPGLPLAGLIFHVSRCGSTLFTQILGASPRNIVAAEPPIIDDILRTIRREPSLNDEQRIRWLRGAIASIGQRKRAAEEKLFVKLDCWSIFDLGLLRRAFPGVPMYFLHRHPLEVLVSLMRVPSLTIVRDTVLPAQMGLSTEERDNLSHEAHAATILGAIFKEATAQRDHLIPVDYAEVADFVRTQLLSRDLQPEEEADLRRRVNQSAKAPERPFLPDSEEKRRAASPTLLEACASKAEPAYRSWLHAIAPSGPASRDPAPTR